MKTQLSLACAAALATLLPIAAISATVSPIAPQSVPATTKASIGKPTPPALPVTPFGTLVFSTPDSLAGTSYGTQTLGITSFIITNGTNSTQFVEIFNLTPSTPGDCTTVSHYGNDYLIFYVPALQSTIIPFPTALAFAPVNGTPSCVSVYALAQGISVNVTGFLQ
jgi:hypothetical protein